MVWENYLRNALEAGRPTVGTRIHSAWPTIVELVGYTGSYDYVEFAAEYAPFDILGLENLGRALDLHRMTGMIKVGQEARSFQAVKALNGGFQAVNFADVRSAADARECVRSVRAETPGVGGLRGVVQARDSGHVREVGTPAWVRSTQRIVVSVMIEKKEAVEDIEAILDVGGIDMVTFGPADYAMSLGFPGERSHPAVLEARSHVLGQAVRRGIAARGEIDSPEQAKAYLALGVRHFTIGLDVRILHAWWTQNGAHLRDMLKGA